MISMKLSKEEAGEYTGAVTPKAGDGPAYPYGLCLYLDDETLKKLGYTEPPAVGTELLISAKVVVTSTGVNQQQDGDKESRCDMQITDMELAGAPTGAAAVYSASKMNP
jgi:hypothetical protein